MIANPAFTGEVVKMYNKGNRQGRLSMVDSILSVPAIWNYPQVVKMLKDIRIDEASLGRRNDGCKDTPTRRPG